MKVHVIAYEKELNIEGNKLAVYFRNSFLKEKETYEKDDIEEMYSALAEPDKQIITGLVRDLLPNKNKDAFIGFFLKEFLKEEDFTSYSLAKLLYEYTQASYNFKYKNENAKDLDLEAIKSKIQKLLKSAKTKEDDNVIQLIADYFNVSFDVLLKGEGVRYSIDLEHLYEIVDSEGLDADTFLEEHLETDYDFDYNANPNQKKKDMESYKKYIHHSVKAFSEIVEQQLSVDSSELIIEEDIWIEWSADTFAEIFGKLSDTNQKVVVNVLRRMYLNNIKNN